MYKNYEPVFSVNKLFFIVFFVDSLPTIHHKFRVYGVFFHNTLSFFIRFFFASILECEINMFDKPAPWQKTNKKWVIKFQYMKFEVDTMELFFMFMCIQSDWEFIGFVRMLLKSILLCVNWHVNWRVWLYTSCGWCFKLSDFLSNTYLQ